MCWISAGVSVFAWDMICAACVKLIRSCKCVFFADFPRPETQRFGGTKNLNEINEANQIVVLFGAVFIACSTEMWEIDDEMGSGALNGAQAFERPYRYPRSRAGNCAPRSEDLSPAGVGLCALAHTGCVLTH